MPAYANPFVPDWAKAHNLRILFNYDGPSETVKQIFGYRWEQSGYDLGWLHRRATGYDRNLALEMQGRGANAGCIVWSAGFSLANDQYHWDIVRRRIAEYHSAGMHALVYISLTNCFWKEMFANEPSCQGWRQVGPDGQCVPYSGISYGDKEVTRYLMCVNNPAWRAYQKRRIRAALAAGADGIFWDNNFTKCHCPTCQKKFRQFTRQRLGKARDLPRPLEAADAPPEQDLRKAREVVFDWIPLSHPAARAHLAKNLFRYLCIADILRELYAYARSLKPDVVWSSNGHLCQHIYDATNLLLSEDCNQPSFDRKSGRLRTNAGVLKYLYEEQGRSTPAIANSEHPEAFAFGAAGYGFTDPQMQRFLADNGELFRDAQSVAKLGVLAAEMNYINRRSNWFDNLLANHILFDVLPLHRLDRVELGGYDVLLLRSMLFLSDADCRRLRQFVQRGGTLISTNATSLYDENWKRRKDYGLADVFGISARRADKPQRIVNRFGQGCSIFYPGAIELEVESKPGGRAGRAVAKDILEHLADPIIQVKAPPGVAVNLMQSPAGLVIHVLNYTGRVVGPVKLALTQPGRVVKVLPIGRGSRKAVKLPSAAGLAFSLEKVDKHTAVVVGKQVGRVSQ